MITPEENADRYVDRLATACKLKGLAVEIVEPSTRLTIRTPGGPALMAETVALRPDKAEMLTWYWSWGTPICPAGDIEFAVTAIFRVVADDR